jgi:predicted GNAT superfamily acetyltransferase
VSLLRPIEPRDRTAVLDLNAANVELLAPMDADRLEQLRGWADLAHVVEHEGAFAGFLLTFRPGTAYDSENYRWFSGRYDDFYYLDRIVLVDRFRRLGLGGQVYDEVERRARAHGRMALEVNLDPPNVGSLAFHDKRGFVEVGTLGSPGHVVSLRVKSLQPTTRSTTRESG